jgi:Fe-S cluster biogenesis protein NfuA
VGSEKEFQEKIRQLGTLVGELDQVPGAGSKVAARELVQLLMEVHGAGLERMMEIVFESSTGGEPLIDKLGRDPIVRNLLLLYSLHPDDLETRVLRGLDTAGARLRKFEAQVELVSIQDGAVQIRLDTTGHSCGSTTKNLKAIVEESIYDEAPDLTSLSVLVPDEQGASGFVSVGALLNSPAIAHPSKGRVEVGGAD